MVCTEHDSGGYQNHVVFSLARPFFVLYVRDDVLSRDGVLHNRPCSSLVRSRFRRVQLPDWCCNSRVRSHIAFDFPPISWLLAPLFNPEAAIVNDV